MILETTSTARRLTLLLLWISSIVTALPNAPCYFPGREPALLYQPCDQFAFVSACCPSGFTCFENSLCVLTDPNATTIGIPAGTAFRPTCTNPEWNDEICGDYCLDRNDSGQLTSCGNDTYCCRSDELTGDCDCDSGTGTISIAPGEAETIIGITGSNFTTIPPVTRSSTIPSTSATSTSVVSSTDSSAVPISSSSGAIPSATVAPITGNQKVTDTTGFKVGVGIGCTVAGLLILGLIFWFCFARRRRQQKEQETTPHPVPAPYPQFTRSYSQFSGVEPQPRTSNQSSQGPSQYIPESHVSPLGPTHLRDPSGRDYYTGPGPLSSNPSAPHYNMSARIGSDVGAGVPDMYTHLRPVSEVTEPSSLGGPSPVDERNSRAFNSPYLTVDLINDPENPDANPNPHASPVSPLSSFRSNQRYQGARTEWRDST